MVFRCKAKNGELDFGSEHNQIRLKSYLLDNEGKELVLKHQKPKRSLSQNAYYWVYLGVIERETGNDANELHDFFRSKLLPPKTVCIRGNKDKHYFERPTSTTELNKLEFGDYLDKICAMTNVPIPDREEAGFILN